MSTEESKAIARRFYEDVFSDGKLELLDHLLDPHFIAHDAATTDDAQATKKALRTFRTAFPDFRFTIEAQLTDGDKVVNRWTVRGTHLGDLFGILPTSKTVESAASASSASAAGRSKKPGLTATTSA
jgi:predicted ester cyclase